MIKAINGPLVFGGTIRPDLRTLSSNPVTLLDGGVRLLVLEAGTLYSFASIIRTASNHSEVMAIILTGAITNITATTPSRSTSSSTGVLSYMTRVTDIGKSLNIYVAVKKRTALALVIRESPEEDSSPITIPAGLQVNDKLNSPHGSMSRYYQFIVPSNVADTITFSLESLATYGSGNLELYVNPAQNGFYHVGQAISAVWSSKVIEGQNVIEILMYDKDYIKDGGAYLITVGGDADVDAEFSVRVTYGKTITTLTAVSSVNDRVVSGSYNYYRLYSFDDSNLVFDLLPFDGDSDIMVSCKVLPTGDDSGFPSKMPNHYNFSSSLYLEDIISIDSINDNWCKSGVFYIAVYGFTSSVYTLSVTYYGDTKVLTNGVPIYDIVYRTVKLYYIVQVGFQARTLNIQLFPESGDCDLYVKMKKTANIDDYDYVSNEIGPSIESVVIKEEYMCFDCWVSILVYGYETTKFKIVAYFDDSVVFLSNGVPSQGSVEVNNIQFYALEAASVDGLVSTTLTLFNGPPPSIYMSNTVKFPNSTSPNTFTRRYDTGNSDAIFLTTPIAAKDTYTFIGIEGVKGNSTYTVRAHHSPSSSNSAPTLLSLLEGVPQVRVYLSISLLRIFFRK